MVNLPDDAEACPYCGYAAHIDFWETRNMVEAELLPSPRRLFGGLAPAAGRG